MVWRGRHADVDLRDWIKNWAKAVNIVAEECQQAQPAIEVLRDYNVDFRPDKVDLKNMSSTSSRATIPSSHSRTGRASASMVRAAIAGIMHQSNWTFGSRAGSDRPGEEAKGCPESMRMQIPGRANSSELFLTCRFPNSDKRYRALKSMALTERWKVGLRVSNRTSWLNYAVYSWTDAPPLDDLLRK